MQDPTRAGIGERVRAARIAADETQQTLATKARLATATLARVEAGEETTIGTLMAIAEALGVELVDLVGPSAAARNVS